MASANDGIGAATVGAVAGWKLGVAWQEPKQWQSVPWPPWAGIGCLAQSLPPFPAA